MTSTFWMRTEGEHGPAGLSLFCPVRYYPGRSVCSKHYFRFARLKREVLKKSSYSPIRSSERCIRWNS